MGKKQDKKVIKAEKKIVKSELNDAKAVEKAAKKTLRKARKVGAKATDVVSKNKESLLESVSLSYDSTAKSGQQYALVVKDPADWPMEVFQCIKKEPAMALQGLGLTLRGQV